MKKQILQIINNNLLPDNHKKSKYGEVFTPMSIINDMLDTLPNSVWGNPDLKWLDPTSGIGNFPIAIYWRLMDGLSTIISNEADRSRHIIENMMYMVEICENNVKKTIDIFNIIDKNSKLNIVNDDFFNYQPSFVFDIIVDNPPYNIEGTKGTGKKHVYVFFVIRLLEILKNKGFLLIIHPSTYRLGNYKLRGTKKNLNEIYTNYQIHNICMYSTNQTYELMNVQVNVDYLLLEKTPQYKQTEVIDLFGNSNHISINPNDTVVNFGFKILEKLKNISKKYGSIQPLVYRSSELHHNHWKTKKVLPGNYPVIHLLKHYKKGHNIYTSNKKHTHQDTPKIIINSLGVKYILLDIEGKYGVTDSPFIILSSSELLYKLLTSKLFNYIVNSMAILGNNLNSRVFDYIPNINFLEKSFNKKLYSLLELTDDEIHTIESFTTMKNIQNLKLKHRVS
jgi:hypothetical protein